MSRTSQSGSGLFRGIVLTMLLGAVFATTSFAHDGLHDRIVAVTREIEQRPKDASLLVARADLYRQHGDWNRAFADLEKADGLDNHSTELEFVRGAVLHDLRRHKPARAALDKFLGGNPRHVRALQLRGQVLESLGESKLAARDWTEAIRSSSPPTPEQYVSRARCVAKLGGEHVDEALRGLAEGRAQLGSITSLHLCALDVEVQARRFEAALGRLEELLSESARKDQWLAKKGDVLVAAGRPEAAKSAYEGALRSIAGLHPKRRRAPATLELIEYIKARLTELAND